MKFPYAFSVVHPCSLYCPVSPDSARLPSAFRCPINGIPFRMNAKGEQQKNQMHEEVFIDFTPEGAGKPCAVYCKTYGNLRSGKRPLLVIHGGPGLTHDYLLSIADLASPPHNIPIVFYDQLGCGRSTRLPEKMCDTSFWTLQLYLDELNAVLTGLGIQDDYDILGQSWGGMLAATFAAQQQQPRGLKRLVLSNTCVSTATWMRAYARYRDAMPSPHREILEQPRVFDTPDTPEYDSALAAFYARHVMTMEPFPADYARSWDLLRQDPTVALST